MTLRYQVDPAEPLTFMDVKVGKQVSRLLAVYHAMLVHMPFTIFRAANQS